MLCCDYLLFFSTALIGAFRSLLLRSTIETSDSPLRRPAPFQSMPTTPDTPLWDEVKFINGDPYYYTRRDKEAIHTRLYPDNINRDSGIEIPEVRMSMIKKHNNRRAVRQRTAEGANHLMKQRGSKCTNQSFWEKEQQQLITAEHHAL